MGRVFVEEVAEETSVYYPIETGLVCLILLVLVYLVWSKSKRD